MSNRIPDWLLTTLYQTYYFLQPTKTKIQHLLFAKKFLTKLTSFKPKAVQSLNFIKFNVSPLVVVTMSRFIQHSFIFTERHSISNLPTPVLFVYSYCRIKVTFYDRHVIVRHIGRSANVTYSIISDHRQVFFVISVDPPVKQGNARYPFIICLFDKDQTVDLELEIDEGDLKEKYDNKLQRSMSGATFEVVSRLMKAVTSRKITVPGSYKSDQGTIFEFPGDDRTGPLLE